MHFLVTINNTKFVLDAERFAALVNALDGAQQIDAKHVGAGKGTTGYNKAYLDLLVTKPVSEALTITVLPDSEYNTLKLVTASQQPE